MDKVVVKTAIDAAAAAELAQAGAGTTATPQAVDQAALAATPPLEGKSSSKIAKAKKVKRGRKPADPNAEDQDAEDQANAAAGKSSDDDAADGSTAGGHTASGAAAGAGDGHPASGSSSHMMLSTQSTPAFNGFNFDNDMRGVLGFLLLGVMGVAGGIAGSNNQTDKARFKGFLIDSPVGGVDYYINGVFMGQTAADGSFTYAQGDKVTFKIGTVLLGTDVTVATDGRVMLQDLAGVSRGNATDLTVLRLAQLLQSLDADNNPDNGITIDRDRLRENLPDTEIEDTTKIASLLKDNVKIVQESDALDHLNNNSPELRDMDDAAPTAQIMFDAEMLATGQTATVRVVFDEPVTLWADWADLVVLSGGGKLSEFVSEDGGLTYTATYTPPAHTTAEVSLSLTDDYTDFAGNRGMEESATILVDTQASVASITLPKRVQKLEPVGVASGNDTGNAMASLGADGSYAVVWQGPDAGGDSSIFVQSFNADGTPKGAQMVLQAPGTAVQQELNAQVTPIGSTGQYGVTFVAVDAEGVETLYLQTFNADGSKASDAPVELALPAGVNRNGALPRLRPWAKAVISPWSLPAAMTATPQASLCKNLMQMARPRAQL